MDERAKEILDNLDAMKIGLDEPFRFGCTMCGKCCINREDILLSPRDIYNMSRELQLPPDGLVSQYGEVYVGADSRIPIVRLRPRGRVKRCRCLKTGDAWFMRRSRQSVPCFRSGDAWWQKTRKKVSGTFPESGSGIFLWIRHAGTNRKPIR